MSSPLEYHPAALPEIELIKLSYESNRVGLGDESIVDNPSRFAIVRRDERIARMFRFPYLIRFRILHERIRILSVIHSARNTGDWTRRR